jgi:general secretion pathway protein G
MLMIMVLVLAILALLVIAGLTGLLFRGCNLRHTNSQDTNPSGKIKTSTAALGSLICGIAGLIFLLCSQWGIFDFIWHNYYIADIFGWCWLSSMILGIVLGIIGYIHTRKSVGVLKRSGFAITGLALNIIIILQCMMPVSSSDHHVSKRQITNIQILEFKQVLESYANDNGSYPTNEQGLAELASDKGKGPYLKKALPVDPWGRPYHYRNPGERIPGSYDLWSNGSDDIEGTADDITNFK